MNSDLGLPVSIIGLFAIVMVALLAATSSGPHHANASYPESYPISPNADLVIATFAEDPDSPQVYDKQAEHVMVALSEDVPNDVDAVMVSHAMVTHALDHETARKAMHAAMYDISRQHLPLLAIDTSPSDLAELLDIALFEIETETTDIVLTILTWDRQGVPRTSVTLISKGRPEASRNAAVAAGIRDQVMRVRNRAQPALQRPEALAQPESQPQAQTTAQLARLAISSVANGDIRTHTPYLRSGIRGEIVWDDCPFGVYRETVLPGYLANDMNDQVDFHIVRINQRTTPGVAADPVQYPDCDESSFRTSRILSRADVQYAGQNLTSYGPTTTGGLVVAHVSLGISHGGGDMPSEWSFPIPDIQIRDRSDFAIARAEWEFDFNTDRDPAQSTFLTAPGISVSINEGAPLGITRPLNLYWLRFGAEIQRFDRWFYTITPTQTELCRPSVESC